MKYERMMICEGCGQAFWPNKTATIPAHTRSEGQESVHVANESECIEVRDEIHRNEALQAKADGAGHMVDWQSSTNP